MYKCQTRAKLGSFFLLQVFQTLDLNSDRQVTLEEVYSSNMEAVQTQAPGLVKRDPGETYEENHDELWPALHLTSIDQALLKYLFW